MGDDIKRHCNYYNWGSNPLYDYPCPREYGARCEFYNEFFSVNAKGITSPLCKDCEHYEKKSKL